MTEREAWLEARKKGIGGSDAASVCGMNPWKSNLDLWREKTGRKKAKDISDSPYVKYGKECESYLREIFKLDFPDMKVEYDEFGMISNDPDMPFAFATLDGKLTDKDGRNGILEIKTTQIQRSEQWKQWDMQIPDHYYIQVLHQLMATRYDFAVLKAQIKYERNGEIAEAIRHYHIEWSEVENDILWLSEQERDFWTCVQSDKPPAQKLPEI